MKSYAPLGGSVGHARSRPAPPARTTRAEAGQAEQMGLEPSTFMICVAKTPLQERDEAQHDGGRRRGVNAADLLDLVPQAKRERSQRARSCASIKDGARVRSRAARREPSSATAGR